MTILSSDIRLLESERMTDTTDGGGRRTSRVIPDGVAGNIFPKVSRVDSVYGRVNLRKIYPHINTANLDVYAGAHFVITDAPDNDRISVLAFSTGSDFDLRAAARDRIESYVIAGPESRMTLYGRQLKEAQAILAYQREEEPLPEIGDVYAISNEVGGVTTAQQFVRVQDVTHEVRTFQDDSSNEYRRRVVTLKIGSRLRHEFAGIPSPSRFASVSASAAGRLRTTTVADAARYYGIQPLSAAVSSGALELSVASVYAPIVPTTQRETALSLASVAGAAFGLDCATVAVNEPTYSRATGATNFVYRTALPIKPGTLVISDGYLSTDNGAGVMVVNAPNNGYIGTVDYESGTLSLTARNPGNYPPMAISYVPQAYVSQAAHTHDIPVTLATRGTVYAVPLLPLPAPGTLIVDFRALGKWYRLRDNGAGELVGGDAQYGTGTVDYVTGGATITLGALPDVGSSVLLSWGSPTHYQILAATPASSIDIVLASAPIKPGTVVLTWMDGATAQTATDNSAGAITGHATGTIEYQTGALHLVMSKPGAGAFSIAYDSDTPPTVQSSHEFGGAIAPHSVLVTGVNLTLPDGSAYTGLSVRDNGLGELRVGGPAGDYIALGQYTTAYAQSFGSVNYDTGVVTMAASIPLQPLRTWDDVAHEWVYASVANAVASAASAQFTALPTAATPAVVPRTQTATLGTGGTGLALKLGTTTPITIVPGSVLFTAFGKRYIDRNGTVYTDVSATTGSGTAVGSISYATGEITLSDYPAATAANLSIIAALGRKGDYTATSVAFRTAGSPIRPASLYVQVTALDGELLVGTADQSGIITGGMTGEVEQTMGVVNVEFSKPVLPGTLRYSAVVLSNLPLDAEILGLDPVRLPSDGRVPIFRPADVTVIHHTDIYNAGTPAAGGTINVGRTDLSALWLEDANKKKLAAGMYAVDLAAGTATMAADLSLTGYVPPILAKHRIEEMGLLSDVQINGQLTLTAPLLRSFPAGSQLSSALLYGDLQARVTNVFDQQTWTGVWQSTRIGDGATAQYNDVDYPIEVTNDGAITERWRLNFTSTTSFQVIGENLGVIGTGTTGADLQIVNPLTGLPYFTLRAAGFGLGWPVGGNLRLDTIAAAPPTWLARCVLPGAALTGDSFDAQLRGDVD
ncbi:MAG TPA: hypothetical protein DET46_06715 [Comamonadaceae bacterium]|nr:MAG: hypothetical protein A3F76_07760 [Burkholderiales bacterium RIFCSPLOWO2_12_FULL_65_40]HCE28489.1 hypothetical protein [Comamonadaceae bacterium]